MILETGQGTVDLNQIKTLYEQGVRKWLLSLSGGCDSGIISYIAAKMIVDNNWQDTVELYAMTGDSDSKPFNIQFAKQIIKKVEELTGVKFLKHYTRTIKADTTENYTLDQISIMYEAYKDVGWGLFWHGITQNPPADPNDPRAMHMVNTIDPQGPDDDRNAQDKPRPGFTEEHFPEYPNENLSLNRVHPLINLHKKSVADVYKQFGLMDSLFPVTRSCENPDPLKTNNFTTHCETDCWWCWERHWGFDRII